MPSPSQTHGVMGDANVPKQGPQPPDFWSSVFFIASNKFFNIGAKRQILETDLNKLPGPMLVENALQEFEKTSTKIETQEALRKGLNSDRETKKDINIKAIIQDMIFDKIKSATYLRIGEQVLAIATASVFKMCVTSLKRDYEYWAIPIFWVFVGVGITFVRGVFDQHSQLHVARSKALTGQILRGLLYKRFQTASYISLNKMQPSLITKVNDYEFVILANWIGLIPTIIAAPISLFLSFFYLAMHVGFGSVYFLAIFITLTLVVSWLHHINGRNFTSFCSKAGQRTELLNEMLPNMKEIKTSSYEGYFRNLFSYIRDRERTAFKKVQIISTMIDFFLEMMPLVSTFVIICWYNSTHEHVLSTAGTFTIVALLSTLGGPLRVLSNLSRDKQMFDNAYITVYDLLNRLESKGTTNFVNKKMDTGGISLDDATFSINDGKESKLIEKIMSLEDPETKKYFGIISRAMNYVEEYLGSPKNPLKYVDTPDSKVVLNNLNVNISSGQKVCMIGTEGSGRSMFMLSLLGETDMVCGAFSYNGKISYLNGKDPLWLVGASIKENVTMEEDFDNKRFKRILNVVQLDITKFAGKSFCEVQADGSNFNENDRRKILLARCLYTKADIYLLDGVFDSMDMSERKNYFTRVVLRELRDATVIFTNTERTLARLSDKILVFNNGYIEEQGDIDHLDNKKNSLFNEIVNTDNVMGGYTTGFSKLMEKNYDSEIRKGPLSACSADSRSIRSKTSDEMRNIAALAGKQEQDEIENIDLWYIWKRYMLTKGPKKFIKELCIIMISVGFNLVSDVWLGLWSSDALGLTLGTYLAVYTILSIITAFSIIMRNLVVRFGLVMNGDTVHFKMVDNIMRSTLSWFSMNTSNRIIHRFVHDQNNVDDNLSDAVIASLEAIICLLSGVLIFNFFYSGFLLLATFLVLCYMLYTLQLFLSVTSSFYQIADINSTKMTSVFNRMMKSSYLLRSMNKTNYLDRMFYDVCNTYQSATTHFGNHAGRWLGIRNVVCATILVFMSQSFPILGLNYLEDFFSMDQFWQITMAIAWGLKCVVFMNKLLATFTKLSVSLITLEKCFDWVDHQDTEPTLPMRPYQKDEKYMAIEFKNVSFSYDQKTYAVKDTSLVARSKERIALLGDVGCGKADLTYLGLGLFKPMEKIEQTGINIFGIPIDELNPCDLRRNCSYIFKEGKLFSGTVRDNINSDR